MLANIESTIEMTLAPLAIKEGCKIVLAYSGGVDSESLAHGLSLYAKKYPKFQYLLLHVHHGLSCNADKWAYHCETQAKKYQLPINICRVHVATGPRLSVEAEARKSRYQAIIENMGSGDILLTAHHEDDQLETLLLAIKRGLGPKGLASMGIRQIFDGNKTIVRPLLSLSRQDIEAYAHHYHLSHIEDESNKDTHYDRNFLRCVVVPQLKERWPSIATTASRSAFLCADQQMALNEEIDIRLASMLCSINNSHQQGLDLHLLEKQTKVWQSLLLRSFIELSALPMPSQIQLEEMLLQLLHSKEDAKVEMRLSSLIIRRFQHFAFVFDPQSDNKLVNRILQSEPIHVLFPKHEWHTFSVILPNGELHFSKSHDYPTLRLPKNNESITIGYIDNMNIKGSLRCHPHFRAMGRELKKIWQELSIPGWERNRIPLVFYNNNLVAVAEHWIEKSALAGSKDRGVKISFSR